VLTLYPLERYTAQLFFAELVCLPLVIATAITHGLTRWRRVQGEPISSASGESPFRVQAA
jgi:hypothetical protein